MSSNDPPPTGKFRPRKKAPSRTTSSGSRITPGATTTGAEAAAAPTDGVDAGTSAAGDTSTNMSRSGRGGRGRPTST
eukprot:CAMPEP_0178536988 /NCGR_PEP_ID=MMETSP0696-20121128/36366_1 /TAXON_ID=265572 /ORGANISM="Extubocellulus spinifer, Strain CCMP396" /LENGTH=76 /DNA_ID=CAMNT_0020169219 /DNA_START=60 /DNA_END=287 /DNA_ORIENTATION=-